MKRFLLAWASAALLIAACGDSGSSTDTTGGDTSTGTDTIADTTTNTGTSAITGVSTAGVTCTEPTAAAGCTGRNSDAANVGFSYPWCGLSYDGTDFTCQGCPNGRINLQGNYRRIKDGTSSPPVMDFDNFKEILDIDGNTFHNKILDDAGVTLELRGYFMCAEKPEQLNERTFWNILTSTESSGEYAPGAVLMSDHIIVQGTDQALVSWSYDDAGVMKWDDAEYCRIGSKVQGVDCTDPFAN